eukprot:gnl/Chilomastix_cuspidata/1185.p1 GENE.gnl/Chilomastix_cuspidata/1185~~gnl/Chilomastix_cuspidata/1185.p1  ORF type:complete len:687 (-),score=184.24 gnl/Chilomastix_cuspidata/1185:865-2925(-)
MAQQRMPDRGPNAAPACRITLGGLCVIAQSIRAYNDEYRVIIRFSEFPPFDFNIIGQHEQGKSVTHNLPDAILELGQIQGRLSVFLFDCDGAPLGTGSMGLTIPQSCITHYKPFRYSDHVPIRDNGSNLTATVQVILEIMFPGEAPPRRLEAPGEARAFRKVARPRPSPRPAATSAASHLGASSARDDHKRSTQPPKLFYRASRGAAGGHPAWWAAMLRPPLSHESNTFGHAPAVISSFPGSEIVVGSHGPHAREQVSSAAAAAGANRETSRELHDTLRNALLDTIVRLHAGKRAPRVAVGSEAASPASRAPAPAPATAPEPPQARTSASPRPRSRSTRSSGAETTPEPVHQVSRMPERPPPERPAPPKVVAAAAEPPQRPNEAARLPPRVALPKPAPAPTVANPSPLGAEPEHFSLSSSNGAHEVTAPSDAPSGAAEAEEEAHALEPSSVAEDIYLDDDFDDESSAQPEEGAGERSEADAVSDASASPHTAPESSYRSDNDASTPRAQPPVGESFDKSVSGHGMSLDDSPAPITPEPGAAISPNLGGTRPNSGRARISPGGSVPLGGVGLVGSTLTTDSLIDSSPSRDDFFEKFVNPDKPIVSLREQARGGGGDARTADAGGSVVGQTLSDEYSEESPYGEFDEDIFEISEDMSPPRSSSQIRFMRQNDREFRRSGGGPDMRFFT